MFMFFFLFISIDLINRFNHLTVSFFNCTLQIEIVFIIEINQFSFSVFICNFQHKNSDRLISSSKLCWSNCYYIIARAHKHTHTQSIQKQLLKIEYCWYDLSIIFCKLLGMAFRCGFVFSFLYCCCCLSTHWHACIKTGKILCSMDFFFIFCYWPEFATFDELIECNE